MKIAVLIVASIIGVSCQDRQQAETTPVTCSLGVPDTVFIPAKIYDHMPDTIWQPTPGYDSMRAELSNVKRELMRTRYTLARIKFYLSICNKHPSQDKFLKGWMNRALKE